MDILARLTKEHSKALTVAIVEYIGDDKKKFAVLMSIFLKGEYRLTQRAAWPFSYIAIEHPTLIRPYFDALIKKLKDQTNHPAIARNILRTFQEIDIPKKYQGTLVDICFSNILNFSQPIAIRAFSISVASKICLSYPELKNELLIVLNDLKQLPQVPAIKVRITYALKAIAKSNLN